jgi:hypothetical protein
VGSNMATSGRHSGPVVVAGLILWAATAVVAGPAAAIGAAPCAALGMVFARGSGQPLGHREAPRFFQKLAARLGPAVTTSHYELGSAAHGGARYPAAGVGVDSAQAMVNVVDAWTGVEGGSYRASVQAGGAELAAYLAERTAACPTEPQVVGGYSQGAQTVGDSMAVWPAPVRARVAFVALFGDPRLHLPEGKGWYPAACRGGTRSPWRRGDVGCLTDNGILGARDPYAPSDAVGRIGSWCDRDDPICNGNPIDLARSTHSHYSDDGSGMDQAVTEIAAALHA